MRGAALLFIAAAVTPGLQYGEIKEIIEKRWARQKGEPRPTW
jgi:hypothetical protein